MQAETTHDFLCFCPFHGNNHTPSFSVSKTTGEYICFNGACNEFGGLLELVKSTQSKGDFEAMRIVSQAKKGSVMGFQERLEMALAPDIQYTEFRQSVIDTMKSNFWDNPLAIDYMHGRGFDDLTLERFDVGYSAKKNMIVVPFHTVDGLPIGVIGRGITEKVFKNSHGLHTSQSLFNLHRAKRTGGTVIVVESSFDVMANDQAGYPNTVACLMGNFSQRHREQLERYFSTIILMTDFDDKEKHKYVGCRKCGTTEREKCIGHNPGRALGETIAEKVKGKTIRWAAYDYKVIYPHKAKDTSDMSEEERRQCIKNAVSNYEYHQWNIER